MKLVLFGLGILLVTTGIGSRAEAQNHPWCALYDLGDASWNCGFVSREQCMATVSGIGGLCTFNTTYQPPPPLARVPPLRKARKSLSHEPS